MVTPVGPLATISCEPRQARKGATVAVTSCAGVWLAGEATRFPTLFPLSDTRACMPSAVLMPSKLVCSGLRERTQKCTKKPSCNLTIGRSGHGQVALGYDKCHRFLFFNPVVAKPIEKLSVWLLHRSKDCYAASIFRVWFTKWLSSGRQEPQLVPHFSCSPRCFTEQAPSTMA